MNIPIYRAKVIGLDNNYIIGFYQQYIEGFEDNVFHEINNTLIDQTTLAIHFPDMLDSQGNKIFASLSEDGKGGDIMKDDEYYGIAKYINCEFVVEYENCYDNISEGNFEVVGVPE